MASEQTGGIGKTIRVTFEVGNDSKSVVAFIRTGRAYGRRTMPGFPDKTEWGKASSPKDGDIWDVEIIATNPKNTVFFLRPVRLISTAASRKADEAAWEAKVREEKAARRRAAIESAEIVLVGQGGAEFHQELCGFFSLHSESPNRYEEITVHDVYCVLRDKQAFGGKNVVDSAYQGGMPTDDGRTRIPAIEFIKSDKQAQNAIRPFVEQRVSEINARAAIERANTARRARAKLLALPRTLPFPSFQFDEKTVELEDVDCFGVRFRCKETKEVTAFFGFLGEKTIGESGTYRSLQSAGESSDGRLWWSDYYTTETYSVTYAEIDKERGMMEIVNDALYFALQLILTQ